MKKSEVITMKGEYVENAGAVFYHPIGDEDFFIELYQPASYADFRDPADFLRFMQCSCLWLYLSVEFS